MKTISSHYINGEFVESHGRKVLEIISPTTERVIAKLTLGNEKDAKDAIAAAAQAFTTFSLTTQEERVAMLRNLNRALLARIEDLSNAMVIEFGGCSGFVKRACEGGANIFLATERALQEIPMTRSWAGTTVTMEPVGVAGIITPGNANALALSRNLAAAIAAGCTLVMKPSELTALQTQVWIECVHAAGLPKGVCNVVMGRGDVVGAELVRNPEVSKISFTGSATVGRSIMRDGAATMKRVTLELGGKSPNIILDDADFKVAIPNALTIGFLNNGEACVAGSRLLVPRSRYDEAKQAILDVMPAFPVGDPACPTTAVGPMANKKHYERVLSYIRKGIEEGAEILVGGEGRPAGLEVGYFVKPTVFVNVSNDMTIAREEIFGPVLSVIAYEDDADAVRIANDTEYGLCGYVSGSDLARVRRVALQIRAGRIVINGMLDDQLAPFGGFKNSGIGREYGAYGIQGFLEPRAILE